MIRPLRVRHRRMVTVGAIVLPVLFTASLAVRPGVALSIEVPGEPSADRLADVELIEPWPGLPLAVGLADGAVSLAPRGDLVEPDLLLYWSGVAPSDDALPSGAFLIGEVPTDRPATRPLPAGAAEGRGFLVLFSLAHFEVVASAPLERAGD